MSNYEFVTIWNIDPKPWMNVIAPIARPLFRWIHDMIMGWGEAGLRNRLGV